MKKLLLSLAVIAASGAYAAYENPLGGKAAADASANIDALPRAVQPAEVVAPVSQAKPDSADAKARVALAQPIGSAIAPAPAASASAAPVAPTSGLTVPPIPATPTVEIADMATDPVSSPTSVVVDIPPPAPVPLPRMRPASAPVVIEAAQATRTQPAYRDGTFKGRSTNAYYGRVQVDAVIRGGQLVSVGVLSYPNDRRTSRNINSRALPVLEQEAIQAQSANIDVVSGATLTSEAYARSLDAALSAARNGGNNA